MPPTLAKIILRVSLLLTPYCWPGGGPTPTRSLRELSQSWTRSAHASTFLLSAWRAPPGLKDRKTRLAAPPKRSWQWRKDEERDWWQGGGGEKYSVYFEKIIKKINMVQNALVHCLFLKKIQKLKHALQKICVEKFLSKRMMIKRITWRLGLVQRR